MLRLNGIITKPNANDCQGCCKRIKNIDLLNMNLIVSFDHIAPYWTCYDSLTVRKNTNSSWKTLRKTEG